MATPDVTQSGPLRIVVCDNDPGVLELLAMDLTLEGHQVVATARTGEQALLACEHHQPDVLIVDYRMPPGMNGLETIRRVQASKAAGSYVLYSNYRSPTIATEARRLGARYVSKGPLRLLRSALLRDQERVGR